MKKSVKLLLVLTALATVTVAVFAFKNHQHTPSPISTPLPTADLPVVYVTRDISPESLIRIFQAVGRTPDSLDRVAVKISTGESGGHHYLQPSLIGPLVQSLHGTIVECNTAYPGSRNTFEDHWKTIREHGFLDIAPVDLMDEEGDMILPVRDSSHIKYNIVGSHLQRYTFMVNLAHFKGHVMAGFGGVLKNQSIGVASAKGKSNIHSAGKTSRTYMWAVRMASRDHFCESMAAAAQSVADYFGPKIVYIDVMNNLSVDCDCMSHPATPKLQDYGILASTDPVALDQACLDILDSIPTDDLNDPEPIHRRIDSRHGRHIVEHAEAIGMGSRRYRLVSIDTCNK